MAFRVRLVQKGVDSGRIQGEGISGKRMFIILRQVGRKAERSPERMGLV